MRKRICVIGVGGGGFHYAVERLVSHMRGDIELVLVYTIRSQARHNWASHAPVRRAFVVRSPSLSGDSPLASVWWTLVAFCRALAILWTTEPDCVLAVGTALAVPFGAAARLTRIPLFFVESMTRIRRPSRTGRLIDHLRLARCHYVQWPALAARRRVTYAGAISMPQPASDVKCKSATTVFGTHRA